MVAFCLLFLGLALVTIGIARQFSVETAMIVLGVAFLVLGALPDWESDK